MTSITALAAVTSMGNLTCGSWRCWAGATGDATALDAGAPRGGGRRRCALHRAAPADSPNESPNESPDPRLPQVVGTNPAFLRELAKLPVYAACDAGVLVLGESGTSKEVFAQAVHRLWARAGRPWVAVNCGALPTELVESELFGHARGAFTTALANRAGLGSEVEGGTLFLDDVDCLPPAAQDKLLRFP